MRLFTITFWLAVAACLYMAVGGCAATKSAAKSGEKILVLYVPPAALGWLATPLGPVAVPVVFLLGSAAWGSLNDAEEFKSGDTIGKDALAAEMERRIRESNEEANRRIAEANAAAEREIAKANGVVGTLKTELNERAPVSRHTWLWLVAGAGALWFWLKGHHLIAAIKSKSLARFLNVLLPSWMQKKIKTS